MKKISLLILLFYTSSASAIIVSDWNGKCGAYKYDNIYAAFQANSYTCAANTFLPKQTAGCQACPNGFDCAGGTFTFSETADQGLVPHTVTCPSGKFLPAGSETCTNCPTGWTCAGGTFSVNRTEFQGLVKSATYMAGNENGVCAANYAHKIYAVFQPIVYSCNSGYFLPASAETCAACPAGYSCAGGSFYYNRLESQGLTRTAQYYTENETNACAANFNHNFVAVFVKDMECSAGYYAPASATECSICPAGSYCTGGTYAFNANNAQGITQCGEGYNSAAGASSCTANTISVRWGDSNGNVYETTTCTFGGALNTPTTEPTAPRGHHFTGWTFN